MLQYAEVAELVDALDSGSSGRMAVGVQVPSSALAVSFNLGSILFYSRQTRYYRVTSMA
jgi:hypothetical protein